jgi:hypothetical protein
VKHLRVQYPSVPGRTIASDVSSGNAETTKTHSVRNT